MFQTNNEFGLSTATLKQPYINIFSLQRTSMATHCINYDKHIPPMPANVNQRRTALNSCVDGIKSLYYIPQNVKPRIKYKFDTK
jgi:hypothetical protein